MNAETISISDLKSFAKNSTEERLCSEIVSLFALKCRSEQEVRDLASEMLDSISQERLVLHFKTLMSLLRSRYPLLTYEVERIIKKIKPELLEKEFDYLLNLRNDPEYLVSRVARLLLPMIAITWPINKKQINYKLIIEWQESQDIKVVELANLMALQVMSSWQVLDLEPFLPFLKKCTNLDHNNFETSELAATLAFSYLSVAPMAILLLNLDYLTSFNDCGNKELRRSFRHLALETLRCVDSSELHKYGNFIFRCLEGRNKDDRRAAWSLLTKIKPDKLPVCDLVYCQACGLYRVRHAGRMLIKNVSEEKILEHLEEFLQMQESNCPEIQSLAMRLLLKIPREKISTKKQTLEKYQDSRSPMVNTLENLLSNC